MIIIHFALCMLLAGICICRIKHTDDTVPWPKRWAYIALTITSEAMAVAPWQWGMAVSAYQLAFELAVLVLLLSWYDEWSGGRIVGMLRRSARR